MDELTVAEAIELIKTTADELPGFNAQFALWYTGRVTADEPWSCYVEGDLVSVDDDGGMFYCHGRTPQEAIQRAVAEALRRIPPPISN
jgi:hypothetical protein